MPSLISAKPETKPNALADFAQFLERLQDALTGDQCAALGVYEMARTLESAIDRKTETEELADAIRAILAAFVHIPGDEAGNKVRTQIFAKCVNMRQATNNARQTLARLGLSPY